jgi:hypothetical protein
MAGVKKSVGQEAGMTTSTGRLVRVGLCRVAHPILGSTGNCYGDGVAHLRV